VVILGKGIQSSVLGYKIRVVAVDTTDIVKKLQKQHDLSPMSSVILGRVATAAILLGSYMSEKEKVTVIFDGDGESGQIVAESNSNATVRGYINNTKLESYIKENGKFDVSSAVGKGSLYVVRDLGLKDKVTSNVEIVSGEIAEDIAYYLNKSEQLPSAVSLGVLTGPEGIRSAGGVMIQIFDGGLEENEISLTEKNFINMPYISNFLYEGNDIEDIIHFIGEPDYIKEFQSSVFCDCSKEKALSALIHFSSEELEDMKNDELKEISCKWCSEKYNFNEKDIDEIIYRKKDFSGGKK